MKTFTIVKNERDNINVYGAIILGLDKKFGFARDFISYRYLNDCSSKHAYYDYYIDVSEGQFFEIQFKSAYKFKRYYYQLINGEFIETTTKNIIDFFENDKKYNEEYIFDEIFKLLKMIKDQNEIDIFIEKLSKYLKNRKKNDIQVIAGLIE